MAKKTKKQKIKGVDRNALSIYIRKRINPVELAVFLAPIEQLVLAIEKNDIYEDQEGKAVFSMLDKKIGAYSVRQKKFARVDAYIHSSLELYFQVAALTGTNEQVEQADDDCIKCRELIKSLNGNGEVFKSQVIFLKEVIARMRYLFSTTLLKDLLLVNRMILSIIDKKNGACSEKDLRTWLLAEIERREANQKKAIPPTEAA